LLPPLRAFCSKRILTSISSYSNRLRYFRTMSCSSRSTRLLRISATSYSILLSIFTLVTRRSINSSTLKSDSSIARRMHLQQNSRRRGETSTAAHIEASYVAGLFIFSPSQNSTCSAKARYSFSTTWSPSVDDFWKVLTKAFQRSVFARTTSE
jgi:hypothetical protein